MNVLQKAAAFVVVLLGVAALLFALRTCSGENEAAPKPKPAPSASASATPSPQAATMSTTTIEQAIKAKLDQSSGRATRVTCPDRVAEKVGTTFGCDVFFEAQANAAAVAKAAVKIDGPDGHFTWSSKPTSGGNGS